MQLSHCPTSATNVWAPVLQSTIILDYTLSFLHIQITHTQQYHKVDAEFLWAYQRLVISLNKCIYQQLSASKVPSSRGKAGVGAHSIEKIDGPLPNNMCKQAMPKPMNFILVDWVVAT